MSKYLFIAEKPSLMRAVRDVYKKHITDVKKKVGEIEFVALSGHVCRLLLPNEYTAWNEKWKDIDLPMIPSSWKIGVISDKKKTIDEIKKKIKETKYDGVIVGTDADTEGNGIYYLLEQYLKLEKMKALRFFEQDQTDKAILTSLLNMTDYHKEPRDVNMTNSFLIRSHMDWLIGMNFSVGFTVKSGFLMKVGRVKAPTLKLVYDNSKAIDEFVPHSDYELQADYKEGFTGTYMVDGKNFRFETKEKAKEFSNTLGKQGTVISVEKKKVETLAPALYKLSDVQVDAGKQFGYAPSKTVEIIQRLYEVHKIVSYPRTDGRFISSEKAKEFPDLLKAVAGIPELSKIVSGIKKSDIERVSKDKHYVNDAEVKKASHDALLPTGIIPDMSKLNEEEKNILRLIYKRLLAIFLPSMKEDKSTIVVDIDTNKFKSTGKIQTDKGWTVLYDRKNTDVALPTLKKGDTVNVLKYEAVEKTTTPPARFTQATLVDAMENISRYIDDKKMKSVMKEVKGIGMPSSRAKIISDLLAAGYMEEKGKSKGLYITELGKTYISNLKDFSICKPELTAVWETKMQGIREGTVTYKTVEKEMIEYVNEMVKEIDTVPIEKHSSYSKATTGLTCPICGADLLNGKYGIFCPKKCGFSISNTVAGKKLTEKNMKDLCLKNKTTKIKGFTSKAGKKFDASLKLEIRVEDEKTGKKKSYIKFEF